MKILFFSPHAFFSVHALPEALVAEALLQSGHEINMVTCDGIYRKHCLCMSQIDFTNQIKKEKICVTCKANRNAIVSEFKFKSFGIESFLDKADEKLAEEKTHELDRANYLQFDWDGIPVAKYALYEFWLNHKLSSEEIEPALWSEYLVMFENALKTLLAVRRMIQVVKPDRIVCYNSLYSVNRVMTAVADKMSVPHFTLHAGRHHKRRLQQMTVFKGIGYGVTVNRLPAAEIYRKTPCTVDQVNMVTEHVQELFKATSLWVYSIQSNRLPSLELLKRFAVRDGQKVLLAVMRSNDERLAAQYAGVEHYDGSPLFSDQYQWFSWLVGFARSHPEYVIVFRVHPREFPNKREGVTSQNASVFMKFIDQLDIPENFHINLPKDNLSLHDLLKIADVLLNNTSTVGLEASLFGIPVVGCGDEMYAFDLALQDEPSSLDDYANKISEACASSWRFSRVIGAYRWLNYVNTETSIDIADGYDPSRKENKKPREKIQRLRWRLRKFLGLDSRLPQVEGRARPLSNASKLTYTIINNVDSHVGVFPMEVSGNAVVEREKIRQAYASIMESIRDPNDDYFRVRVTRCLAHD